MSDLKNCPFCGNLLEIVRKNGSKYVRCISGICVFETARHGYHITDDELIKRCNRRPAEDAKDKEIERLKADNQVYRDILNSLLNEEVYHLDNATMTNIKYELDNRGKDTNVPTNAPDTNVGTMEG